MPNSGCGRRAHRLFDVAAKFVVEVVRVKQCGQGAGLDLVDEGELLLQAASDGWVGGWNV